ncbi:membrane protein [Yinghuangia aomiensis]|uniref:Membrane protein n=1 Tax=Yinghuangia aomiensis TaxID=676205 RepID=A0ABP9H0L1_9ACTN
MRLTDTKRTVVRVAHFVRDWIKSAPGTYIWYLILFITTFIYNSLPEDAREVFLKQRSTNIDHLSSDPVHVLVGSALWTSGGGLVYYAIMFTVFHAVAEQWLGTWRWLSVVVIGHVGATYLSQGLVLLGIHAGALPGSLRDVVDVGVSYGLKAVMGVLVWYVARPWRWLYLAGIMLSVSIPFADGTTFTDIGHLTSVLLGLACYPLARGKGTWDPAVTARTLWARRPRPHKAAVRRPAGA